MAQNSISKGTLKADFGITNLPILALKMSKEAYWIELLNGATSFYQNDWF